MMKNSKDGPRRTVRYLTALASGAWLFQSSGCIIDDATTNPVINLSRASGTERPDGRDHLIFRIRR